MKQQSSSQFIEAFDPLLGTLWLHPLRNGLGEAVPPLCFVLANEDK